MTSSAKPQSLNLAELEDAIERLGGNGVFFFSDGSPRANFFTITRPLDPCLFMAFIYGDEPTCPKPEAYTLLVERAFISQAQFWCLTWNGLLVGEPIRIKDR